MNLLAMAVSKMGVQICNFSKFHSGLLSVKSLFYRYCLGGFGLWVGCFSG